VLGVVGREAAHVPDNLSTLAQCVVAGCNQKTARAPVIEATDAEVLTAADGLKSLSLVFEGGGSRVVNSSSNMGACSACRRQSVALLRVLMLRGPQTAARVAAELRALAPIRRYLVVEGFLDELAAKAPARVVKLPRAPGEREARWAHLLCGEPAA